MLYLAIGFIVVGFVLTLSWGTPGMVFFGAALGMIWGALSVLRKSQEAGR
jgi:F0F1-type ATP synthase assembly protein I